MSKEGIVKKVVIFIIGGLLMSALAGCGTIAGVGEDLKTMGGWITRGSDSVQKR